MADRVSDDRAPGRAPSGPFDDRWPSTARTSAAPPSPGSAIGSRVQEPGPSPVAQPRPGITPSPPDVVPQIVGRAARAAGAGAHPERRHAHARSGVTVAPARTADGPIARRVMLAGVIWRSLGRRVRSGGVSSASPRMDASVLAAVVAEDRGTTVQAPGAVPIGQQRVRESQLEQVGPARSGVRPRPRPVRSTGERICDERLVDQRQIDDPLQSGQ